MMFDLARNTLTAGVAALALGAVALSAGPAQAGASTGTWRNGMQAGPGGVGCYDPGCAARNYGYGQPRYGHRYGGSGYRPVQAYPSYRRAARMAIAIRRAAAARTAGARW